MSSGINPIILKAKRDRDAISETVRLSPEARKVVRRLRAKTQLSTSEIVSSILIQSENLIDFEDNDDEETED